MSDVSDHDVDVWCGLQIHNIQYPMEIAVFFLCLDFLHIIFRSFQIKTLNGWNELILLSAVMQVNRNKFSFANDYDEDDACDSVHEKCKRNIEFNNTKCNSMPIFHLICAMWDVQLSERVSIFIIVEYAWKKK